MFGMRVIVPVKLRSLLLDELHEGHPGIVRSKQLARSYVWRPSIQADLEHRVKACGAVSPGVVTRTSCSGGPQIQTARHRTRRDQSFWVVQPSVDPVTSSAPTASGPDVSQEIQTAGARRYPLRNRRPPQKYQAGV
ncbi:hypothetical protein MTO96_035340 [Rhipicephalus appendiculatus]